MIKLTTWDTYYFISGSSGSSNQDVKAGWDIYYQNNGDRTYTIMLHPWMFVINSNPYSSLTVSSLYSSQRVNYGGYQSSSDGSTKIISANSSGSYGLGNRYYYGSYDANGNASVHIDGSFSVYMQGATGTATGTKSRSTSCNVSLPNVGAAGGNVTSFSASNITMNSFLVNYSADVNCDWAWYSLNSGGWTDLPGTRIISGLNPGTYYTIKIKLRRTDTQVQFESGAIGITTVDKNRITSTVDNVTNESSLTVTVSRASGSSCNVYLELLNDAKSARLGTFIVTHENVTNSTTFTASELKSLAQNIPNSNSAVFRVNATTGSSYNDTKDSKYNITNANPTFTNCTFEDTNSTCVSLTGNNQLLIKGKSTLKVNISSSNKMIANVYSTASKYRLNVGSKSNEINYSTTDTNVSVNNADSGIIYVTAIDSRGNSTPVTKTTNIIDYINPIISSISLERQNGVGNICNFKINGTYKNVNFGSKINTITKLEYSTNNGSNWTDITNKVTYADGIFTNVTNAEIAGFTVGTQFTVLFRISDGNGTYILSSVQTSLKVGSGEPALDINIDKKGIGVGCIAPDKGTYNGGPIYMKGSDGTYVKIIWSD